MRNISLLHNIQILRGTPSLLLNGYMDLSLEVMRLATDVHLEPRSRMSGAIPSLLLYAFMHVQGQLYPFVPFKCISIAFCPQMFPQVATVSYPTPRALNPAAFQTAATVAAVPPVPPATPNPSPKQRVFTGTVTKVHDNFGFVDEDVFFQTR